MLCKSYRNAGFQLVVVVSGSLVDDLTMLLALENRMELATDSGCVYVNVDREACTSSALSKEQASAVVLPTARFMNSCSKEQIQLAPEKWIGFSFFFVGLVICC